MTSMFSAWEYMQMAEALVIFCRPLGKHVPRPLEFSVQHLKLGAQLTTCLGCLRSIIRPFLVSLSLVNGWTVHCPQCSEHVPYFGQTGAITNPKAVFTRWKEELQQALAWVKLQRTRRGPTYFSYLHRLGFHNFLLCP